MAKKKRVTVTLQWNKKRNPPMWEVLGTSNPNTPARRSKTTAIDLASSLCRNMAKRGFLVELVIKNRNGKIGKGSGSRRTYPRPSDPWASRG